MLCRKLLPPSLLPHEHSKDVATNPGSHQIVPPDSVPPHNIVSLCTNLAYASNSIFFVQHWYAVVSCDNPHTGVKVFVKYLYADGAHMERIVYLVEHSYP